MSIDLAADLFLFLEEEGSRSELIFSDGAGSALNSSWLQIVTIINEEVLILLAILCCINKFEIVDSVYILLGRNLDCNSIV
jgi:hypothetical protein